MNNEKERPQVVRLSKLHLENYRNLKELDLDFGCASGKIVGMNRIGKTNCLEAICYLLTDKLLGGSADIPSVKRKDDTRAKVVVEGTFFAEEGTIVLRKEFYEKWVRPRGSATEELQGHVTDYYVNGAKQARAKDFFEAVEDKFGVPSSLGGLDAYQLLIDPFYLGETICGSKDWKLARKAIVDIIGDVKPEEIFGVSESARIAKADLEAHQFDDGEAKKAIRGEIDGYKKKTIGNEAMVNEFTKLANQDVSDEEYKSATERAKEIDNQIAMFYVGASNPFAEETGKLQGELYELQNEYGKSALNVVDRSKSRLLEANLKAKEDEIYSLNREIKSVKFDIKQAEDEIEIRTAKSERLKAEAMKLKGQYNSVCVESVCPTCGQSLPEEKVKEAENKKKAEIIAKAEEAIREAKDNNAEIEKLRERVLLLLQRDFEAEESKLRSEKSEIQAMLDEALLKEKEKETKPDPKVKERIEQIRARLNEIQEIRDKASKGEAEQIAALKSEKDGLRPIFDKRISADNARSRIKSLKEESAKLGNLLSDAEQRYWAVGEYVKAKLELLDEHMASKFGEVRFQLIKENIKAGSYDEVCVPYIVSPKDGKRTMTLFPDGSKSEQIYTGIQIIKAIREAKGLSSLPILFDQGGELDSVSTEKVAMEAESQIIAVKVEGNGQEPTFVPILRN